jgi:hypothetical protein
MEEEMIRILAMITVSTALLFAQAPKKDQKKAAGTAVTLTGCIDQETSEQYVLLGNKQLNKKAILQPGPYPNDGFAQFVGHTVEVRGRLVSNGDTAVVKVSGVKRISELCRMGQ